jgi:hypothetical protein
MKSSKLQKVLKAKKEQAQVVPVVLVETLPIVTPVVPAVKEEPKEEPKVVVEEEVPVVKSSILKKKKDEPITQ